MKIRLLSAALAAMLVPAAAWAATDTVDGVTYTFTVSGGKATITATDTDDAKVVNIPDTLGGATVTTLGSGVLQNHTTLQRVVLPETVTSIGGSAFNGCIALTSCNIPSGVTAIPVSCFYGCSKLRRIVLPVGLKSIGDSAFRDCIFLEEIVFPDGLTSIGDSAFYGCSNLSEAILPESVTSLGLYAFSGCSSLVKAHLPSGLKTVPAYVFWSCDKLSEINMPHGLTSIGYWAFFGCASLREIVIPATVTSVEDSAFYGQHVVFLGRPPVGLPNAGVSTVVYPKEYGELWAAQIPVSQFGGFVKPDRAAVTIVSADVRENDPTVLDVVYKVTSAKPTVKIRALAFEDGIRSFANVTRPETFVDGTAPADWDAVEANVEHTLSWKVSADFTTDLAKMKFEILAVEDGLLPLELTTIPANGTNKAMEISWNRLTDDQVLNALFWLYADKNADLTLVNGELTSGDTMLTYEWGIAWESIPYIFAKMGYSLLDGNMLSYANELSRLGLEDGTAYAYRWLEGE